MQRKAGSSKFSKVKKLPQEFSYFLHDVFDNWRKSMPNNGIILDTKKTSFYSLRKGRTNFISKIKHISKKI